MLNKSIAYRLSIYISLAVISVFIAFIGIYLLFNEKLIEENAQNKVISLSAKITNEINQYIVSIKEITANISEQVIYYEKEGQADHFIKALVEKYSYLNSVQINIDSSVPGLTYRNYYCYSTNDSINLFKSNEKFETCLTKQIWIKQFLSNKLPAWSEPYMCKTTKNVVVALYYPITVLNDANEKVQVGEVFCELSLLELNKSVNKIKIGENGFAFLLSKKGVYITHPKEEWILKKNIFDLSDKVFDLSELDAERVQREGNSGTLIARPEILNYQRSWVYYSPISDNGWISIFVLPVKELYQPLYLPILQMLFFSVLGILIIYLLITYIANKQIQPLSSLTHQLKRFSNLAGDTHAISANEVAQVSESLNYMKSWYEKYKLTRSQEAKTNENRERDIAQASEIQRSFINTEFPVFPERNEIDLYGTYIPAKGVSGDLYDFFFIDSDHLIFTMGDVSGKGIPAGFYMSVAQTIIKKNANNSSAKSIVTSVNKELYTNNQHQFFLTLFLGVLNIKTGILSYCNAAHTITYILKPDGKLLELAQSHGLPLGLYPDKQYKEAEIKLEKGDSVVLYTDGVTELNNENKLLYGNQRFEGNLKNLAGESPKEMIRKMEKSLELFKGDSKQSDDISMLILNYKT